jgi:hypothetical protein
MVVQILVAVYLVIQTCMIAKKNPTKGGVFTVGVHKE